MSSDKKKAKVTSTADETDEAATTSKGAASSDDKMKERQERLAKLRQRQHQARVLNRKEVLEEDRRAKLPSNWERQKERLDHEEQKDQKRKEIEESGQSFDRVRALDWTAEECDQWERKRLRKHNPDMGFSNFEDATHRQYERLTKQIEPDMENYEKLKNELGEDFYATTQTLNYGTHKPSTDKVEKMVAELNKQVEKRKGYSRQRVDKPNADVDFINERNMRFNRKIDKFYGKYTTEIKQNLERGTAI